MYRNTILGSEGVLIREAIRSPNYVPGVSGWTINKDGTASFVGVSVVGTLQSTNYVAGVSGWKLDSNGVAEFSAVTIRTSTIEDTDISGGSLGGAINLLAGGSLVSPTFSTGVSGWEIAGDVAEFNNITVDGAIVAALIFSSNYVAGVSGWAIGDDGTAEFNNIQVRGAIVADEIFSTGFDAGEGDITGWYLGDDGSAAFSDVTIGAVGYQIDSSGHASFANVSVNETLLLAGEDVGAELALKAEIVKAVRLTGTDTDPSGAGDVAFLSFIVPDIKADQVYEVVIHSLYFKLNGAVPTWINCSCWYRYNANPTPPTTGKVFAFLQLDGLDGNLDSTVTFSGVIITDDANDGDDLHLQFRFNSNVANVTVEPNPLGAIAFNSVITVLSYGPTDIIDVAITGTGPGGGGGTPTPQPPTQKVAIFQATSTSCYAGSGGRISTTEGRQGNLSPNGNMKTAFGLPGTIAGVLAGSTINRVEVGLYYHHWWFNSGGVAVIGYHNSTDAQVIAASNQSSISGQVANQGNFPWARNEVKYVDLPIAMGNAFRDGSAKGLLIGQGLDNNLIYYGKCDAHDDFFKPTLRITYTS